MRVQNDKINILGKTGMQVMVNNKIIALTGEDLTNYLKTIPVSGRRLSAAFLRPTIIESVRSIRQQTHPQNAGQNN